jgi:uncharacterized protein DUF6378
MTEDRVEHERRLRWPAVGDRVKWKNEKGEWRYGAIELEAPQLVPEGHEPMCVAKGDDGGRRWLSVATDVFTADEASVSFEFDDSVESSWTAKKCLEGCTECGPSRKIYHSSEELLESLDEDWANEALVSVEAPERAALLNEAKSLILGDRNNSYGPPDQDFRRSAEIMNALGYRGPEGREILARDIATLLIAVKLSRLTWSPEKRDHYADIAGYIACGWECKTLEEE